MTLSHLQRRGAAGIALWLLLITPPLREILVATMLRQMLLQLPLLALAGWCAAALIPSASALWRTGWNRRGISGLLLASFTGMVWMLPRLMDASLSDPATEWAKFFTVPLLLGLSVALSWPRAGFVVRGVVLAEVIATAIRLGWLYLISPVRLCGNYLITDQQRLGTALLVFGFGGLGIVAARLMWGRVSLNEREAASTGGVVAPMH